MSNDGSRPSRRPEPLQKTPEPHLGGDSAPRSEKLVRFLLYLIAGFALCHHTDCVINPGPDPDTHA